MIEFIIREGPMFEAMIMNKEIGNPKFRYSVVIICPVTLMLSSWAGHVCVCSIVYVFAHVLSYS